MGYFLDYQLQHFPNISNSWPVVSWFFSASSLEQMCHIQFSNLLDLCWVWKKTSTNASISFKSHGHMDTPITFSKTLSLIVRLLQILLFETRLSVIFGMFAMFLKWNMMENISWSNLSFPMLPVSILLTSLSPSWPASLSCDHGRPCHVF